MNTPANLPVGFQFVADPAAWQDASARVVRLHCSMRSKRALLAEYVQQLSLPDYFGWNWDALEECLRDLHWLPATRRVALVHEGVPLRRGSLGRRTYVQLLQQAASAWAPRDEHELAVIFPSSARDEITRLLDASSS